MAGHRRIRRGPLAARRLPARRRRPRPRSTRRRSSWVLRATPSGRSASGGRRTRCARSSSAGRSAVPRRPTRPRCPGGPTRWSCTPACSPTTGAAHPENKNLWRGTAADALSVLAAGESIRREILGGRPRHIHQALTLGTTWTEVAEALGRTMDQVRAELRHWADENPDLYYGADQRVPVAALLELGDDEAVPAPKEDQ
ncbi:hypothetical protein NKH77_55940 [Streptomyces sp. M19]